MRMTITARVSREKEVIRISIINAQGYRVLDLRPKISGPRRDTLYSRAVLFPDLSIIFIVMGHSIVYP
jgi:hypothetical protein